MPPVPRGTHSVMGSEAAPGLDRLGSRLPRPLSEAGGDLAALVWEVPRPLAT